MDIINKKDEEITDLEKYDYEDEEFRKPLWIEKDMVYHIQLSCGGPGDGFHIFRSDDGCFHKGEYYSTEGDGYQTARLSDKEIDLIVTKYGLDVD